jgi:hypothetical protein
MALVAELLSLPNAAAELNLSPQRKREKLFEALLNQLESLARGGPVLMAFEDAHWVDPTSRELLDLIFDRVSGLQVLLVVTFRPEFQHPWSGRPRVSILALNRLGGRDGAVLVEHFAGNAGLSRETVEEIVERADGVPLFVEELTKAVVESGDLDNRVGAVLAASPLPNLAIPAALHASLIARLDRLGPIAKEIAQIGAVIGREFSHELIQPVAQRPEPDLEAALDRLTDAGLLFCRGAPPHASYLFKHALVQDAAYATLLRSRRRQLHEAIAAALEREFLETVATQPELLAHHCTEAGLTEQAVQYWRRAGERALERSANAEAIAHLTRGIQLLDSLPQGRQRDEHELVFQAALIGPLWNNCGFGSPEAERASRRALELCERTSPDTPAHFRALRGLAYAYVIPGDRLGPGRAGTERGRHRSAAPGPRCLSLDRGRDRILALARPAGGSLSRHRPNRGGIARDSGGAQPCRADRNRLLRTGAAAARRRSAVAPGSSGRAEGRSLLSVRRRDCPQAAGEILGTARRDEPRPADARSRQATGGPRSSRPGLWLVHRGLRYPGPEGGQDPAQRAGAMRGPVAGAGAYSTSQTRGEDVSDAARRPVIVGGAEGPFWVRFGPSLASAEGAYRVSVSPAGKGRNVDDRAAEHERCLRRLGFEMKPESAGVSYGVAAKPTALPLLARQGPLRRISLRLRGICCFASAKIVTDGERQP